MWRAVASIDHISGGRAGWNLVTSGMLGEATISAAMSTTSMASATTGAREFA